MVEMESQQSLQTNFNCGQGANSLIGTLSDNTLTVLGGNSTQRALFDLQQFDVIHFTVGNGVTNKH